MTPEQIESFAIRVALGNNGGTWAEHYTEGQKEHWRQFVRELVVAIKSAGARPAAQDPAAARSLAREKLRAQGCAHDDGPLMMCDDPPLCDTQSVACCICGAASQLPPDVALVLRRTMQPPAW